MLFRRRFLASGAALAATPLLGKAAMADPSPPSAAERGRMTEAATRFLKTYEVPGLGVAFARDGQLLDEASFGLADAVNGTALTPAHRFRIASISKPITSAAIFTLIERGRLSLDARVLGPGGVLGTDYGPVAADSPLARITIAHLLSHTAGGWSNDNSDPMGRMPKLNQAGLIAWTLKNRPLETAPGTAFAYSNFGYCLLGRVIEKIAGRSYDAYVKETVLAPVGIADMTIAGNTLVERQPPEVRYHGRDKTSDPYTTNVRRMDSHGGWIATPTALVRFASQIDRLLEPETIRTMTMPRANGGRYACGWRVNAAGNWWHSGHLPGTAGILVRTKAGLCWAALLNTRMKDSEIDRDLDRLMWTMARTVPAWRA